MTDAKQDTNAGLEAAHAAYERFGQTGDLRAARLSDACMQAVIDAYLAASQGGPTS